MALIVGAVIVVAMIILFTGNKTEIEYVPLLKIESATIKPAPLLSDVTTIKDGDTATITVVVRSLSGDYDNNGKLKISFEHDDAYQYFEIEKDTIDVGAIQEKGTSGPKSFKITVKKDPGEYKDKINVELFIGDNLNDDRSFSLKLE